MSEQDQRMLESHKASSFQEAEANIFFDLFERVGSFGNYQIFSQVVWCTIAYLCGTITLIAPFLFYQDSYDCKGDFPSSNCKNQVCKLNSISRQQYIPETPTMVSLANLSGDYRCPEETSELDLAQTLMFSGVSIGIFVLAMVGGLVGKRRLLLVSMWVCLLGMGLMVWSGSLIIGGVGMFCAVLGSNTSTNLVYTVITETVSSHYRANFSMIAMTSFAIGGLGNVLWFYLLRDFRLVILFFNLIPGVLVMLALIFFIKDTPMCLVTKNSPENALKKLEFIAKVNKKQFDLTAQDITRVRDEYKALLTIEEKEVKFFTIIDLFRYPSLRWITITMILLDISITFQYFAPTFMLHQFKFDIFINGLAVESSSVLASLCSWYLISRSPRRLTGMVSFSVILGAAIALIFVWDQNQETVTDIKANILVLCLIFLVQLVITNEYNFFIVYVNENYPTQVRIISLTFIKTCGAVILMTESSIISVCINSGFKIMILFAGLAVICIACSYKLPETFGKMPDDMIEELRGDSNKKEEMISESTF